MQTLRENTLLGVCWHCCTLQRRAHRRKNTMFYCSGLTQASLFCPFVFRALLVFRVNTWPFCWVAKQDRVHANSVKDACVPGTCVHTASPFGFGFAHLFRFPVTGYYLARRSARKLFSAITVLSFQPPRNMSPLLTLNLQAFCTGTAHVQAEEHLSGETCCQSGAP